MTIADDTLRLHRAGPDDAATYARVARDTFRQSYAALSDPAAMATHLHRNFAEAIQRAELDDPSNTVLAALDAGGAWAGFVALRTEAMPSCVTVPDALHLVRLYTVREWHGRGAGLYLLDAAREEARRTGHRGLWLQVWDRNDRARRFYAKHGFDEVGTHPYRFADEWEDDLVLQLAV